MHQSHVFAVADPEFYAPLESAADRGELYRPDQVPSEWRSAESTVWTMWFRRELGVEDGWKVHVSAKPDRLQAVLDTVAAVCFEQDVPFKHLSCRLFHQWAHHKHAPRPQSGKFIAAYPPDEAAARRLMEALREALADEDGPFILTDRRFADSRTVHYRYGAFVPRSRVRADGTRMLLARDGDGLLVEDVRGSSFRPPDGVQDPFRAPAKAVDPDTAKRPTKPVTLRGYVFDSAVRHSNAGGAYRGHEVATGRPVFIKEARAHTAVEADGRDARARLRGEWETLRALHTMAPGLAPEPLAHFTAWEHDFLVTEFVDGRAMNTWMAVTSPLIRAGTTRHEVAAYFERCQTLIGGVEQALARLHACGYLFVDISAGNVLVDDDDTVRLVDFEAAQRPGEDFRPVGTPGYTPPRRLIGNDPSVYDDYGVSALAQLLVAPFHHVVLRNPDVLDHLRYGVDQAGGVPERLWRRATRYHTPSGEARLPGPEEVAAAPVVHLAALRDSVADALVAMADIGHPERMFPTIAEGYRTNMLCLAYGAAGVAHALHRAGRPLPGGMLERLRREALDKAGDLAPGLYVGAAGIARVLADQGLLDEARDILAVADRHPLVARSATVFGGSAGLALGHLALYGHTRDEYHVERALALARELPDDDALTALLGPDNATGLAHGRCGIALMLHQLAEVCGDRELLDRGLRLLHRELDRETSPAEAGMTFPVSTVDSRAMPYLYCGSAGTLHVASRYLTVADDERLANAVPRLLPVMGVTYTVMPGLFQGLSGLGFALADHAAVTGSAESLAMAVRTARKLFGFAVPHATGVRMPGDQLLRHSADLWSGSAGVLLFLTELLSPRPDALFTVDSLSEAALSAARGTAG
ncbi:class III lanthionine synthetase LanKC [Streptomyces sp. NBC_01335]|uniref:class III lanthionine synthetase LanKC n=1 Tax=Streptomyces sp. NBC_01335 TaxID=2903828 RepID=UPI002E153861|nr:class III lanthionine synthetase LanKC [Streptomyces sp. NBC_01335]